MEKQQGIFHVNKRYREQKIAAVNEATPKMEYICYILLKAHIEKQIIKEFFNCMVDRCVIELKKEEFDKKV